MTVVPAESIRGGYRLPGRRIETEGIEMQYLATINVPGYLPMDDEPPVFETAKEAWWYLYQERCSGERDAELCDLCDNEMSHGPEGDCDDDSETGNALSHNARHQVGAGTIYGPTPGYRGDHDLGLAYSVTEIPA